MCCAHMFLPKSLPIIGSIEENTASAPEFFSILSRALKLVLNDLRHFVSCVHNDIII